MQKTNPHLFCLRGEAPGAPGLCATRCEECGAIAMPPVLVCARCEGRRLLAVAIGSRAKLLYHSLVLHSADGFEAPYIVGFVETAEGPTAFVPIVGSADRDLHSGSPLRFRLLDLPGERVGFAYEVEVGA